MPIDFAATVLNAAMTAFAETVTYFPKTSASFTAQGVFDEAYQELAVHDGMPVTIKVPVLGIQLSNFTVLPQQGDTLVARSRVFEVREVRIDGHGGAKLMLNFKGPAI